MDSTLPRSYEHAITCALHSRGDAQSGDCHSALEFLGGDLAKAERSARAARQAPLPLAGYPPFYVVSALVLQGEVDESEAALAEHGLQSSAARKGG
jgi:hypothetical protein